jgi:hypothetical protein
MKNFNTLMRTAFALAIALVMFSCGEDEQPAVTFNLATIALPSEGGTVAPASGPQAENASVTLTATASAGWQFVRWEGDASGTNASTTITMNAAKSVVAVFERTSNIVILEGNLTTRTLTNDRQYLIRGQVFVPDGVTVTIQPGTVLYGEKRTRGTLVVDRGGRLIAKGTRENPIVMTSAQEPGERDRGDWGGLVILGRARTNQANPAIEGIEPLKNFGGDNDADNSGEYEFLRVEYAGVELTPNNETNSITMGGVGSGTKMEHLVVSYGGDDGFEWFGGTVNGKYLVSISTWDDDFDVDFGHRGNIQFGLAVRNPFYADQSQSNAFECDNGPSDVSVEPFTTATFSNITVYGPRDRVGRTISANNFHMIDLRRFSAVSIFNSVFTGFPVGLRFNTASVTTQFNAGRFALENNIMIHPNATFAAAGGAVLADVQQIWTSKNQTVQLPAADQDWEGFYRGYGLNPLNFFARYTLLTYPSNPNFALVANGTLATGAVYTHPKLGDFFDKTATHIGGFGATDWTDGWVDFNPINRNYAQR